MASSSSSSNGTKSKKKNPINDLIAGGVAGLVESSVCHPLDTIKTRMQLRKNQVESVPQKIQHSLVEPALRLKHSMQEPAIRLHHSLMDATATATAGTIKNHTATAATASTATATLVHEPASLRSLPTPHHASSGGHATIVIAPVPPRGTTVAPLGPFGTAKRIVQREGFISLYKGLSAVYTGEYYLFYYIIFCFIGCAKMEGMSYHDMPYHVMPYHVSPRHQ